MTSLIEKLQIENEKVWERIAKVAVSLNSEEKIIFCYQKVLFHNKNNVIALRTIADLYKKKNQYVKAIEYYNRMLSIECDHVDVLSEMGNCFLMMDNLEQSHHSYQQSLYKAKLENRTEFSAKTWYGIGILYERFGNYDGAEECFRSVLQNDKNFVKRNELFFRLYLILRIKKQYDSAIEALKFIQDTPPKPLKKADILFHIGYVHESKKDFKNAKKYYEEAFNTDKKYFLSLRQIGYLYYRDDCKVYNEREVGIDYLKRASTIEPHDGMTWYLLGRSFMKMEKFEEAFKAYRQSVFRDQKNPNYWCSIGVLYFKINQQQDALDAYSKAIKLNDQLYQVWYNLGTLYESCGQEEDAIDAFRKSSDINPKDLNVKTKLLALTKRKEMLKKVPTQQQAHPQHPQHPQQHQFSQQQLHHHQFMQSQQQRAYAQITKQQPKKMVQQIPMTQQKQMQNTVRPQTQYHPAAGYSMDISNMQMFKKNIPPQMFKKTIPQKVSLKRPSDTYFPQQPPKKKQKNWKGQQF